jgi:hypothetical protein
MKSQETGGLCIKLRRPVYQRNVPDSCFSQRADCPTPMAARVLFRRASIRPHADRIRGRKIGDRSQTRRSLSEYWRCGPPSSLRQPTGSGSSGPRARTMTHRYLAVRFARPGQAHPVRTSSFALFASIVTMLTRHNAPSRFPERHSVRRLPDPESSAIAARPVAAAACRALKSAFARKLSPVSATLSILEICPGRQATRHYRAGPETRAACRHCR